MTTKRTKYHPAMPPSKARTGEDARPAQQLSRARRAVILARIAKSRAQLDARLRGADMGDLADLPVIVVIARPAAALILDGETSQYVTPPIAPPVDGFVEQLDIEKPNRKRNDLPGARVKVRESIALKGRRMLAEAPVTKPRKWPTCSACGSDVHIASSKYCPVRLPKSRALSASKQAA